MADTVVPDLHSIAARFVSSPEHTLLRRTETLPRLSWQIPGKVPYYVTTVSFHTLSNEW